eukprot:TRINITY_DN8883_c0_g1_i1.p1 TRINITY_DN8883_c0_g1~~TRINITY_DN8883_c0_g1_i1.p1  ORF type:complete len:384 (-),score=144.06 TRINITY_DN8883_c0_g1_i1:86-1237(-)
MSSKTDNFWLVSVPGGDKEFENLKFKLTREKNLAQVWKFPVPGEMKVGTLDSLMSLSDDLVKIDIYVEQIVRKIGTQLLNLCDSDEAKQQALLVNGANMATYLQHFRWEKAQFPPRAPLRSLVDMINKKMTKLDEECRLKSTSYITVAFSMAAEDRKAQGNLLQRDLLEVVKPEHFIETEYMTTLLVVVPKRDQKLWNSTYESLTEFVMPRSSQLVCEDSDYGLYTVTLFKRIESDFKNLAREKRWTVREFRYSADMFMTGAESKKKLENDKKRAKNDLVQWANINFGEAFICWSHIKTIRVFVESILRFGLPRNFQAMLLLPSSKDPKKLRSVLNTTYKHLASAHVSDEKSADADDVMLGTTEKFYPYVNLNMNLDMNPQGY